MTKKYPEKAWEGVAPKNIYVTNRTSEHGGDQCATNRNSSDRVVPNDTEPYTSWENQRGDVNETQFGLITQSKRRILPKEGNGYILSAPSSSMKAGGGHRNPEFRGPSKGIF